MFTYEPIYFFNWTEEPALKTTNKTTHIPLLIILFIPLIEQEYPLKKLNKKTNKHVNLK